MNPISIPENPSAEATEAKFPGEGNLIVPHTRIEGLFVGNGNTLYTKNLVPGEAHNDEILHHVQMDDGTEVEYREWNPYRSKLAAAILCGAESICVKPGSHVLYLGDACGTTISHLSDLVGPDGIVYAVESDNWKALVKMAQKRLNIVPIVEPAGHSWKYNMIVGMVDVLFASVSSLMQAVTVLTNARHFLKAGGRYVIYVKANQMGSTSLGEDVFACLGKKQRDFKPMERLTLKPFDEDHAYVIGGYRMLES